MIDGDTLGAIRMLEEVSKVDSQNVGVLASIVVLKRSIRLISAADSTMQMQELFGRDSANRLAQFYKSSKIIAEGNAEEALAELDKRIALAPDYYESYYLKEQRLIELKKYDEAIKAFNKAIELEPENSYAYADRAMAKYLKGDRAGACEDWKTPGGGAILLHKKYCE